MKTITIHNIQDVEQFIQLLYDEYRLIFHPDDSFDQYIDKTGDRLFIDEDAVYLDYVMQKCFNVCEQNGTNIYDVMEPIQRAEFKKRGIVI